MKPAFKKTSDVMGMFITYSDLFNKKPTLDEICEDIRKIELKKALTIISNFNLYTEHQRNELVKRLAQFISNPIVSSNINQAYIFDVSNLTYSLKMFLAYGTEKPAYKFNNDFGDFWNVLMIILKISDLMDDNINNDIELQQTIQKTWMINRDSSFIPTIAREQLFFEEIARDITLFENEFVDINKYFEAENSYTLQDYISVLAAICANIYNQKPRIEDQKLIGIHVDYFKTTKKAEISQVILDELTANLNDLKNQAKKSLTNIYDNEFLIGKPFLKFNNYYVLFSLPLLNLGLFDSLCFKLQKICNKYNKDFFTFFGRLFEKYSECIIQDSIKKAKGITYEFIPEFKFTENSQDKHSSDAYIKLGQNLLIIECKGGRITKEAKINADIEDSEKNFQKYVIKPIKQANEAYENILRLDPHKFKGIKKVYIFSVALQRFPKLPMYHERLENVFSCLHPSVVHYDYISILDLEVIAAFIEKQTKSIFKFIDDKKYYYEYYPYEYYYAKKYGKVPYLTLHEQSYLSAINKIVDNLSGEYSS